MNLYFRFISLLFTRLFVRGKLSTFDPCTTWFRVTPGDLDMNLHMNNGRYLTLMDLGRFDLLLKARMFYRLVYQGYYPVVVSQSIRFRKSLQPFRKFSIVTRMESWDERDFYLSQTFYCRGELMAEGYIKGRFRKRGQKHSVPTPELFHILGLEFKPNLSKKAVAQSQIEALLATP